MVDVRDLALAANALGVFQQTLDVKTGGLSQLVKQVMLQRACYPYARIYTYTYICMYVCMYVHTYLCMFVFVYVYVCLLTNVAGGM
jgi:hypothetical protein